MNTSRYFKNYFKHNGVVLVCELLIVLLLSLICSILLDGSPRWLTPTLAISAYLLAELRFLMAYIAKCVRRERLAREAMLAAESLAESEAAEDDAEAAEEQDAAATFANDEDDAEAYLPELTDEEENDAESDFAGEDEEDIILFDNDEEDDEVSEATPEDDDNLDIDTFADDEDKRDIE
jgi:Na+-transporting NADH:ubiquinone oxidoreductase subunit NqrC